MAPRTCIVVGCAAGVWDEVKAAQALCKFDAVYCVKQAGIHWPGWFDVWATLHPEYMDGENDIGVNYVAERRALGWPDGYEIVSPPDDEVGGHAGKCKRSRRVSFRWPRMTSSASSGIYAAKVALDDGHDRVVLAGIPMNVHSGHFLPETKQHNGILRGNQEYTDPRTGKVKKGNLWSERDCFAPGFEIAKPFLRGKVRSMSGHTKEFLGFPTAEWLAGE